MFRFYIALNTIYDVSKHYPGHGIRYLPVHTVKGKVVKLLWGMKMTRMGKCLAKQILTDRDAPVL